LIRLKNFHFIILDIIPKFRISIIIASIFFIFIDNFVTWETKTTKVEVIGQYFLLLRHAHHRLGDSTGTGAGTSTGAKSGGPTTTSEDIARNAQSRLDKNSHGVDPKKSDAKNKQALVDRWKTYENIGKKEEDGQTTPPNTGTGHRLGGTEAIKTAAKPKSSSEPVRAWETDDERLAREQRAKKAIGRMKPKKSQAAGARLDSWKSYQQIDAQQQLKGGSTASTTSATSSTLPPSNSSNSSDSSNSSSNSSSTSSSPSQPKSALGWTCTSCTFQNIATESVCSMCSAARPLIKLSPPPESGGKEDDDDDVQDDAEDQDESSGDGIEARIRNTVATLERAKADSIILLRKILQNLVKAAPGVEGDKFRKIRVKNEKIEALIMVDGALQLLEAVGFERQMIAKDDGMEPYLCFDHNKSVIIAEKVLEKWK